MAFSDGITFGDGADVLIGKIQSRIAVFLTLKDTLNKLKTSPAPQISSQALQLSAVQDQLQSQMSGILDEITAIQAGTADIGIVNVANYGYFYYAMEKQIKDVTNLQTLATTGQSPVDWSSYLPYIVVGGGALLLVSILRKRL